MSDRKLTFGELKVDDRFIIWPVPGDNAGHGGYLGAKRVFTKITPVSPPDAHLYRKGYCENAACEGGGVFSRWPDGLEVIKLCPPVQPGDAVSRLGRLTP